MRRIISVAAAALALASFEARAEDCKLVAAWETWDPYQMKDSSGKVTGFDVEFLEGVGKKAGCSVEFQEAIWVRILNGIKSGSFDVTMGASKTPEREEFARFSTPYRAEKMVLFIRKGEASKWSLKSMKDAVALKMRLGVITDYEYGDEYANLIKNDAAFKALVDEVSNSEPSLKKLLAKRIDGFLDDQFVGIALLKKEGAADKVEESSLGVSSSDVHFMLSKKSVSPEKLAVINKGIADFKASPEYKALLDKYLKYRQSS